MDESGIEFTKFFRALADFQVHWESSEKEREYFDSLLKLAATKESLLERVKSVFAEAQFF